jgi:hypothetical protein
MHGTHQMQKFHLMEEGRSPSPPKTKPNQILSLKAIRNHPYRSYRRQQVIHVHKGSDLKSQILRIVYILSNVIFQVFLKRLCFLSLPPGR